MDLRPTSGLRENEERRTATAGVGLICDARTYTHKHKQDKTAHETRTHSVRRAGRVAHVLVQTAALMS